MHSHFNLSRAEQTRRVIRAMENPHADILFHPTARVLQKREPYDLDIDAVIAAAKRTGTVLEIDAYPERLDLKDEHVRKAVDAGVQAGDRLRRAQRPSPRLPALRHRHRAARLGDARRCGEYADRCVGSLKSLKGSRR